MIKNLLVGNGINIQFDKESYTSKSIVLRILKNFDRSDFPSHIIVNYPYLLKNYLGELYLEARKAIKGEYDPYAIGTAEERSLKSFKEHYSSRLRDLQMTDIGFEDYYLIHDLFCHKNKVDNPDQFYIREAMKIAYLYSIYNDGKLELLYKAYSSKLIKELLSYNCIFTTNYDSNIELATGKRIYHIHGSFSYKSDVYISDSLRNQLPDAPVKDITIDDDYYYLYSNAITTHSGAYKEFQLRQSSQANDCIEKMASAYSTNPSIKKEVDKWCESDNKLTKNMGFSIIYKVKHPDARFTDNYHFEEFKAMKGELVILGLSPWNDFHIFECIDSASISSCTFLYYHVEEIEEVKNLLPKLFKTNRLFFKEATVFWGNLYG